MELAANMGFGRFEAAVRVIDLHAAGEPCRVATGGFPEPQGATMIEKRRWMDERCDDVRRALMLEPRGHGNMFGALLCEPVYPEAHLGVVFMDTGGYLNMCGHGAMAVATAAVEAGLVEAPEGEGEVVLDAPAGLVRVSVQVEDGRVKSVSLENVPSFVYRERAEVVVDGRSVPLSIAFGGSFFALVDAADAGVGPIGPETASEYARLGALVRQAVNEQMPPKHPELDIRTVDLVEFSQPAPDPAAADLRHVVVFGAGSVDRSPCGTGLSAKLAALHRRGEIVLGQPLVCESFIGTRFTGIVERETSVAGIPAVVPRISGRAFVTGVGTCLVDPADPLKHGFLP